jgi:KUP system potassium uptake protein
LRTASLPHARQSPHGRSARRASCGAAASRHPDRVVDVIAEPQGMDQGDRSARSQRSAALLSLAALGVVYGDIGTSPLYALRECFQGAHRVAVTPDNVLGVLSLIFWSLALVISIKYLEVVLRADNRGEGGVLALMALIQRRGQLAARERRLVLVLGLFGAALLYGDGAITPAISVMSAIEGLQVTTDAFEPYLVPLTVLLLVGLFVIQQRGTAKVGAVFGPVMLAWFLVIGALGVVQVAKAPAVLAALNPWHATAFFARNRGHGFVVLGSVFLVVTGGEALYADMGHFGPALIRRAWFRLVLPALLANYFGQGALLLSAPDAVVNPFYRLAPVWALYPLIALATGATIIASQAVISGAFSLTRQAVQLGFSPRMRIEHTSSHTIGQIYIPTVNWALMLCTVALVLWFRSSSNMAGAYGVAVASTMVITTVLLYVLIRTVWGWGSLRAGALASVFLAADLAFLGANASKIRQGGWFPLLLAGGALTLMSTWKRGREILVQRLRERSVPLPLLIADLTAEPPVRVPGTAVFLTGAPDAPPALVHNLVHNKVLHDQVVLLTVVTEEVPHVGGDRRVEIERLRDGFHRVVARYGFMQNPDVLEVIESCRAAGLGLHLPTTTFFLGRETLVTTARTGIPAWRKRLFALMSRNALPATAFFRIPAEQVFEVGAQVEL